MEENGAGFLRECQVEKQGKNGRKQVPRKLGMTTRRAKAKTTA
jgi:hypothetical protein